ncbi:hypothetical protein KVF89_04440 [Nocardioides carbamazepini]|uniref:hypothetical protein n=1 Tax=Nocardioides carbamazepini TaxID=2854259 RepID=UPI00214A44E8|nr:hypothetical protein [Nocardioides carbamazepini]MCR1781776.1 hypothetical protein [Nocardioides carbamazepini]
MHHDVCRGHPRRDGAVIVEREHLAYALLDSLEGTGEHAARLTTLRAEVHKGFDDLAQGRYVEVSDADLDNLVADIGRRAAQPEAGTARCSRTARNSEPTF